MSEGIPKRVKTIVGINPSHRNHGQQWRNMKGGGSSFTEGGRSQVRSDPYYTPTLHVERLEPLEASKFLELHGNNIFPYLVREFYSNFQYKDGKYVSVVKGKLIFLNDELFMKVGSLTSDGSLLGDCNNVLWNSYDTTELYKSCLRDPHYYVKVSWLIGLLLKVMSDIASSFSWLLAYGIFISRVIDHVGIDTSNEDLIVVNPREHLIDDSLVHR
ncbi:hypothetical protein Lal_00024479 [Lupinus albus]|nr:hypothetical protein Lal_00024479 [Lupinus albus]